MISNCGFVTPRWYDINCGGSPDIQYQHIPYFHSMLCEWAYGITMSFFWVVVIDAQNRGHLMSSLESVGQLEPTMRGQWEVTNAEMDTVFNSQTQDTIGCIFAESIRVPGEGISIEHVGGGGTRLGHLKGPTVSTRDNLANLEIGFRETNTSFTDFFLRPWSIVTGYKGLISDDGGISGAAPYWGGSIKSNIHLYQLAKSNAPGESCNPSVIRKEFHFFDAVPISISEDSLTYESGGSANKRQVNFTYNYYTVGAGNANA